MKVAANEVERTLMLARDEVRQTDTPNEHKSESLRAMIDAFKLAAQLRDTPIHSAYVRGRKDGVRRLVKVMTLTRGVGSVEYVACLQPYTEIELNGRRRTQIESERVGEKDSPLGYRWEVRAPAESHLRWIRRDRLEVA